MQEEWTMKLSAVQSLWMCAGILFAASLLLDIADLIILPPIYMLLVSTFLLINGWWIMPSTREIRKAQRRRS